MVAVLLIGSGPDVLACRLWPRAPFARIVAINNAWRVRPDWDVLIHPRDFPAERLPPAEVAGGRRRRRIVTEAEFVPAQNAFGGFVYAGATMAFTAAYWILHEYRPRVLAFLGCDMHYPAEGPTHFYGTGSPDPLRPDITLQSLEAKAARLRVLAAEAGTALVNLSHGPSRLALPRVGRAEAARARPLPFAAAPAREARAREAALGYLVASGRYWEEIERFDPDDLARLDALWLAAGGLADTRPA